MALHDLPGAIRPHFEELVKQTTPYATDGNTFVAYAVSGRNLTLSYKRTAWADEFESRLLKLCMKHGWPILFTCRSESGYIKITYS